MADFLTNVIARNLEAVDRLMPRVAARFEPTSGQTEAFAAPNVAGDTDRIYRIEQEVFLDPSAPHEAPRVATPSRHGATRRVRSGDMTPVADSAAPGMSDPHRHPAAEEVQPQVRPRETAAAPTAMPVTVGTDVSPEARRQSDAPGAPHESNPSLRQSREALDRIVRVERNDRERTFEAADDPPAAATVSDERGDVDALPATRNAIGATRSVRTPGATAADAAHRHVSPDRPAGESVAPASASVTRGAVQTAESMSPLPEPVAFQPDRVSERRPADVPRSTTQGASATPARRQARRAEPTRVRQHRALPDGTRAQPETTVHVTIGRIEVKATPTAAPAKTRLTPASSSGLEEYLRRRARGNGQ